MKMEENWRKLRKWRNIGENQANGYKLEKITKMEEKLEKILKMGKLEKIEIIQEKL